MVTMVIVMIVVVVVVMMMMLMMCWLWRRRRRWWSIWSQGVKTIIFYFHLILTSKGKEVIEHHIKELADVGVTFISPWRETRAPEMHYQEASPNQHSEPVGQSLSFSDEGISSTRKYRLESSKVHPMRGRIVTSGGTIISTSSTASYEGCISWCVFGFVCFCACVWN